MALMKIYIPLSRSGTFRQYVAGEVRDALNRQDIKNEIVECITEGEMHSQGRYTPERIKGLVGQQTWATLKSDGTYWRIISRGL
jgi:uncharacterized lipoprotein NlpE involved in copper resistance